MEATRRPRLNLETFGPRVPLLFTPRQVPWGGAVSLESEPAPRVQRPFRLLVGHRAHDFFIDNLIIHGELQMAGGAVPADMFSPTAYGMELRLPDLEPGDTVRVSAHAREKPRHAWFSRGWWRRWFTREGWRDAQPPTFAVTLICEVPR